MTSTETQLHESIDEYIGYINDNVDFIETNGLKYWVSTFKTHLELKNAVSAELKDYHEYISDVLKVPCSCTNRRAFSFFKEFTFMSLDFNVFLRYGLNKTIKYGIVSKLQKIVDSTTRGDLGTDNLGAGSLETLAKALMQGDSPMSGVVNNVAKEFEQSGMSPDELIGALLSGNANGNANTLKLLDSLRNTAQTELAKVNPEALESFVGNVQNCLKDVPSSLMSGIPDGDVTSLLSSLMSGLNTK